MTLENVNLFLLEDDDELARDLVRTLELYCNRVYHADTIARAHALLEQVTAHILICDIHLGRENGFDFLKEHPGIPVIILSGFDRKEYLFEAIRQRVVEYLVKPVDLETLEKALEKCLPLVTRAPREPFPMGDGVSFDPEKRVVRRKGEEISLTAREYDFLAMVMQSPNRLYTPELIERYVFKREEMTSAALKNLILRLRKKLGSPMIETIPNMGYRLKPVQ